MPARLLDNDIPTAGGVLTWVGLGFVKLWEAMTLENVNNFLELLMVLGGFIFLIYKIITIRLDHKIKKHNFENQKKTEEDN